MTFAARLRAAIHDNPLRVQSLICGVCYTSGDVIAQKLEKAYSVESPGKTGHNSPRTVRMGIFGLFFGGPVIFTWFKNLHVMTSVFRYRYVPIQSSASSTSWISSLVQGSYRREILDDKTDAIRNVVVKVIFDQIFFNAAFLNAYLFAISILEGRSLHEAYHCCKRDFHDSWSYMVMFWLPVQCLNFTLVPSQLNGIFVMVMNVCWTTLLSMLNHSRDYGGSRDAHAAETKGVENDELPREESRELERKIQALRWQVTERRSQIVDQIRELEEERRRIDEVLILTDDRKLRLHRQRIQDLSDGHAEDLSDFLKLSGQDDMSTLHTPQEPHGLHWR